MCDLSLYLEPWDKKSDNNTHTTHISTFILWCDQINKWYVTILSSQTWKFKMCFLFTAFVMRLLVFRTPLRIPLLRCNLRKCNYQSTRRPWFITFRRTSPLLGGATSTSSITRGFPASHATAALQRITYKTQRASAGLASLMITNLWTFNSWHAREDAHFTAHYRKQEQSLHYLLLYSVSLQAEHNRPIKTRHQDKPWPFSPTPLNT